MKRKFVWLTLALLCLGIAPVSANTTSGWEVDRSIRFHYAYFDSQEKERLGPFECPEIATFSRPYLPDVTNIWLKGLKDLDFPVPERVNEEKSRFYLKFYQFPLSIDPQITMHRTLNDFLLFKMSGQDDIYAYVAKRENLWIKKGHIAADAFPFSRNQEFPPLRVSIDSQKYHSSQELFDRALPFSSLYVKPSGSPPPHLTRDETAAWSTEGLIAFHRELQLLYEKNFIEIRGMDEEQYRYFASVAYGIQRPGASRELTVIRLPRRPMIFANYADLPMPQDPDRVFLSGLVLVHKSTYASRNAMGVLSGTIAADGKEFQAANTETAAHMLEIGSVVIFRKQSQNGDE